MQDEGYLRIPLGGRFKAKPSTCATLVDLCDAHLAASRWSLNDSGYAIRFVPRGDGTYRQERMHRVILGLGNDDPRQADHINGDTLDNRRVNLRIVTHAQNAQNMAAHRDAKSPYRGVDWFKPHGKWRARACIAGQTYDLGYFTDELEAAKAARSFREQYMTHNVETRH
jgi:HNH endonuclease/AP2 domain